MVEYTGNMVTILSCSDCNVKCKHCYISYSGKFEGENLANLVTKLRKKYTVRINGAEPLIHEDYLKAFSLSGQYGPLTNGLVFKNNYEYLDKIKEAGMRELYISYHFDFHDQVSLVDKKYLQELFKEIKKRGLNFVIMCTITSKNYMNIPQYCKQAVEFGASAIKFTNFLKQGKAKNMDSDLILSESQLKEFFRLLHIERQKYDKNEFEVKRCGSFGKDLYKSSNFKCVSGTDNLCISPSGDVYPCVFLAKPGYEIGKVIDDKIYISKDWLNDGSKCLAKEECNTL